MTPEQKLADDITAIAIAVDGDPLVLVLSDREFECLLRVTIGTIGTRLNGTEFELRLSNYNLVNVIWALHAYNNASKPAQHTKLDQDHVD